MQSGTSVSSWTSRMACAISSTSSASGIADVDVEHVGAAGDLLGDVDLDLREVACCSCAWNALRPVGLIRSPMTQNGCSGPMTTVLDRDSEDGIHSSPFRLGWGCRGGGTGVRCRPRGGS